MQIDPFERIKEENIRLPDTPALSSDPDYSDDYDDIVVRYCEYIFKLAINNICISIYSCLLIHSPTFLISLLSTKSLL